MTAHFAGVVIHSSFLTAMHKAFDLLDIVRLIADNIPDDELKSAVALACCRKSISTPTLDSLWDRQTDFGTLLAYTLPPATWKVVNGVFVRLSSIASWRAWTVHDDLGFRYGTYRGSMGSFFYLRSDDACHR